jgi:hypothetical protein
MFISDLTNYFSRALIKFDKYNNRNVIILKPNCEFLMWKFPTSIIETQYLTHNSSKFNGFTFFGLHYIEAVKKSTDHYSGKASKRIRIRLNAEIQRIWNIADKEIRLEYEKLAFQLKLGNY